MDQGWLVRARRDRYLASTAPADLIRAVRVGGRLTCLALLRLLQVFVFTRGGLHVQMSANASRMRSPLDRATPLAGRDTREVVLHWVPLLRTLGADDPCVHVVDALAHAVRCQPARHAVATLDSALHRGLVGEAEIAEIFASLPSKYRIVRALLDHRAESGTETLMRLMVRAAGATYDLQVVIDGVGRVDILVDGWLVIECDSEEFHSSWRQQLKDRRRDLALAQRGYATWRVTAAQILYQPQEVAAGLRGLLGAHRGR
ncbi:hypothetical protein RZO50_08300 [Microbacterium sp. SSW1-59]|uniref:endonuclease domain-containing protein n=1 Tax=Microbacterium xanthum TaxID=3079794 RepID=UPI002AD3A606|nr:hypothetical protein [Microbacterium sp. SSW1-59]MDZ8201514.1 hypothetical protein [Microbacterium sp. SSW1-59]